MISDRKKHLFLIVLMVLTPVFLAGTLFGTARSTSVPAVATYNDAFVASPTTRMHKAANLLALRADGAR